MMIKRLSPLLAGLFLSVTAAAQSSNDALLYSPNQPFGTARAQALGGAGIGLGGDYSAAHTNPAGIGMFKTGEFLISAGLGLTNNTSNYLGNNILDNKGNKTNFQLPSIGVIFATNKGTGDKAWNNVTFSLGYTRLANYNNKIVVAGNNKVSSFSDTWIDQMWQSDSTGMENNFPLGGSLAFKTDLINRFFHPDGKWDPMTNASPQRPTGGLSSIQQRGIMETRGGLNEFALAVAGNYGNRLYIGGSVNLPNVNYREDFTVMEDDATNNPNNEFGYFDYRQFLRRTGIGIGAKLGVIYKASPRFRLGGAFHTPTYYSLHDSYTADLTANTENLSGTKYAHSDDVTNGYPVEFDYNYVTPLRAMAGVTYFFGDITHVSNTQGFITADYEYVNQSSGKFKMSNYREDEKALNQNISAIYKAVSNIRVGAELKFATLYAARLGFAWYGNPYSSDAYNASVDASRKVYSGGFGYRNKGLYADLAYSYTQGNDRYRLYTSTTTGLTPNAATLDYNRSNVVLTLGLKF
ncbi:OmpP1/FadL family transporter [Chitinophaga qingshengii]|uniref:Outer membrane protein transport protein n=1 Tax=Chitinophaga qingshengii TaxID=1569794 RepID=A0ABR7TLQ3_9BACT|nr:outer membrane protein transport protein [Chitinophaga qingshengii]MBC9929994.1 outer membrane protein transport protein [Chitinophaga qingshengii]